LPHELVSNQTSRGKQNKNKQPKISIIEKAGKTRASSLCIATGQAEGEKYEGENNNSSLQSLFLIYFQSFKNISEHVVTTKLENIV